MADAGFRQTVNNRVWQSEPPKQRMPLVISERDNYHTDDMVIRVTDAYDVQLWSLVLGASEDEVREAAHKVGTDARAVQEELKHSHAVKPNK